MRINLPVAILLVVYFSAGGLCGSTAWPTATRSALPAATSTEAAPKATDTRSIPRPATEPAPHGAVYYVSPTGDDDNPGTLAEPWQTIQKAAETLVAGETVYIRGGVYPERVTPQNSGAVGNEITYAAYPGETATLDGSSIPLPDDLVGLFEIGWSSYIRVDGLHVINAGPYMDNAGILIRFSNHITIENVTTLDTQSSGIGVWDSQHIVVAGNTVERAGLGGGQECITMAISSEFEIYDNTVIDCGKEGICIKDGSFNGQAYRNVINHPDDVGIYVDAWDKPTHDIVVSQNVAFDSVEKAGFAAASEQGGQLSNVWLVNNIAYHNEYYGIEISQCCAENHPMNGIYILNNTLYDNGNTVWGGGVIDDNPQAQNVVIRNNIASQNLTFQIGVAKSVPAGYATVDHNLIDGYRGYEDEGLLEVYGDDYVEGDPLFYAPLSGDFRLVQGSPAIDAGSAVDAPDVDFQDDTRPQDGNGDGSALYDIGADEWATHEQRSYLPLVGT